MFGIKLVDVIVIILLMSEPHMHVTIFSVILQRMRVKQTNAI